MTAWYENARFNVFCECDVFIEDDHFLWVENEAFDYDGSYVCRECVIIKKFDGSNYYMWSDCNGANNDYIMGLEKAPWNIARDIVERELARFQGEVGDEDAESIEDARRCLMEYASEYEQFVYC